MFNCFKKRREEKQRRKSLRNKRLSKKLFNIVLIGMEEYEKQQLQRQQRFMELKAKREAIFSRPLSEVPGTLEYAKLHGGPIHAPNRNVLFAKTN